jgi:LPS sulfotransferase NodH
MSNRRGSDFISKLISRSDGVFCPVFEQSLLIAFSARSGSTAIATGLAHMGLASEIGEILNPRGPAQHFQTRFGGDSIGEYLNGVHENTMRSNMLLFKSNYDDFSLVSGANLEPKLFPGLRIFHLERRDKVLQAVSVYRAVLTNEWHRRVGQDRVGDQHIDRDVDVKKVVGLVEKFERESKLWRRYIEKVGSGIGHIYYEDFDDNPEDVLELIYERIVNKRYKGKVELFHRKLRDAVSLEWAENVRKSAAYKERRKIQGT